MPPSRPAPRSPPDRKESATFEIAERSPEYRIHLCFGPNCSPRGSRSLLPVLEAALARAGLSDRVEIIVTGCRNRCDYGPSMNVYPGPVFYNQLTPEAIEEIVTQHFGAGHPVERWFFRPKILRRR